MKVKDLLAKLKGKSLKGFDVFVFFCDRKGGVTNCFDIRGHVKFPNGQFAFLTDAFERNDKTVISLETFVGYLRVMDGDDLVKITSDIYDEDDLYEVLEVYYDKLSKLLILSTKHIETSSLGQKL